jgi:AraC-like DNA-binding protein
MGKNPTNTDVQFWRSPDLPGIEARYSSYNADAFRTHSHEAYSIALIERGSTVFLLEGERHAAQAGQLVFIAPQLVHACNPDGVEGMTYRLFYVDAWRLESIVRELFGQDASLPMFRRPVVDDPDLFEQFLALHDAIREGADRLERESLLVNGLAEMVIRYGATGRLGERGWNDDAVLLARTFLSAHMTEKISLDDLSQAAHLSPYHLLRVFQNAVGLPPHAHQNQLRIERGKQLLADGLSISRVAVEVGFTDQSHFSRVFKQYTGATPRQYQAGDCG